MLEKNAHHTSQSSCIRCGTCCRKGGPALHIEDKPLVETGKIPAKFLFTIRKHEPSFDNIKNTIIPAGSDIIKVKAQKGSRSCVFFDESISGCSIYEHRPIECKALKCWDTREIYRLYAVNRLTRRDLLSNIKGLWDVILDHQDRCSYQKVNRLVNKIKNTSDNRTALAELKKIIAYDANIRSLTIKQGGMDNAMLEFLFGRPLVETIVMFGIKIKKGETRLS